MQHLLREIEHSGVLDGFVSRVSSGDNLVVEGLWDSVKSLLASVLVDQGQRSLIYVTSSPSEAELLHDDMASFQPASALLFPAWETLPHEKTPPHREIVADRLTVLKRLIAAASSERAFVLVAGVQTVLQKIVSPPTLKQSMLTLRVNDEISMEDLLTRLVALSYERTDMVVQKGGFSVRGGIVDVFPITSSSPVRLEFFGDTVESVREFDPASQRSTRMIERVTILPVDEMALNDKNARNLTSILDYFDKESTTIVYDDESRVRQRSREIEDQTPPEADHFLSFSDFERQSKEWPRLFLNDLPLRTASSLHAAPYAIQVKPLVSLAGVRLVETASKDAQIEVFEAIPGWLKEDRRIYFVCSKAGEKERLQGVLQEKGIRITPNMHFATGHLNSGFYLKETGVIVVPDKEIFHRYKIRRAPRKFTSTAPIRDFDEVSRGDYVVHLHHGIGRFRGIVTLKDHDPAKEFLAIDYADDAKLYVPVAQANFVSKYVGPTKRPPRIDTLGGSRWARKKRNVEKAIEDYATELLELYAARQSTKGTAFSSDTEWQREFEDAFLYEETPDQIKALGDLKGDMESDRPMDRLICGDVGYGKTEVAIRAAFKCVMDNKQVAVLVPTTVLAQQHFHTFSERMADYPIAIEVLSRFKKPAEQKRVIENLKEGRTDIVIGTHRLIQGDVSFKDLALVVVDEEQRFGVKHKERLKHLRRMVDVLTMSATPIPRTLYMSLVGARDMSNIDTPPLDRLPVKTLLVEFDAEVIRSAILRECRRDGQVYFLHNRVRTIEKMKEYLEKIVPEVTIMSAHGQMAEGELETVMEYFINGSIDVLACTTIIESGLDIPNANTIIIDRADRFGLADLYQLRGRVGRWKHQAYAYMMVPRNREILETARKRLKAILDTEGLGGGFQIAMKDLEMRGAGNILGTAQHGHIAAIGFTLYCNLLKRTIDRLKGKEVPEEFDVLVKLDIDASIPRDYIPNPRQRLGLYKRLAEAVDVEEVRDLISEMEDRFGPLPEEARNLIEIVYLKIWAKNEKISRIEVSDGKLIAERRRRKLMIDGRFPRLQKTSGRAAIREIKRSLERVLQ